MYGTPIYITTEERKQMAAADMGDDKQLETQRDIFVFQCMIGCRVSDLYKMTYSNIINGSIEYVPRKTRDDRAVTVAVPLIDAAKELIQKYLDESRSTLFPFICNQRMNEYLKELGELCGIDKSVTITYYKGNQRYDEVYPKYALLGTHSGRRTFICNALTLGIPAQVVMKWTGHSDYKAMKPYIDVADKAKSEAMNLFNKKRNE